MAASTVQRSRYSTRQSRKRAASRRRRERRGFDPATQAEKDAKRAEHRERLDHALAKVAELEGFARFLESRFLNPQLTAGNVALVASQAPGEVVGSYSHWRGAGAPVRKGQSAGVFLTGRAFWPRAVWTAGEVGYPLERIIGSDEAPMPARADVERLHADFLAAVAGGTSTLDALAAVPEVEPSDGFDAPASNDPITFAEPVSDSEIPF